MYLLKLELDSNLILVQELILYWNIRVVDCIHFSFNFLLLRSIQNSASPKNKGLVLSSKSDLLLPSIGPTTHHQVETFEQICKPVWFDEGHGQSVLPSCPEHLLPTGTNQLHVGRSGTCVLPCAYFLANPNMPV